MKIEDIIIAQNSISKTSVGNAFGNLQNTNFHEIYEKSIESLSASSKTSQTTSFEEIFQKASNEYGVPINLLKAVAKAESGFNADAISPAGAQGVMQLMPKTAESLGVENSFDPEQNIMGGAKYLSQMLNNYNGDTTLALAAYNAGPGNVKKYGGVPPFTETQNYIAKVTSYIGQSLDVSGLVAQKNYSHLDSLSKDLNSMVTGVDATWLGNVASMDKNPEDEYITTMFLLNLMEAQNKANSIGKVSEDDE